MSPPEPTPLPAAAFKTLVPSDVRLKVVDIGANPTDGEDPPYLGLLQAGEIDLVGFEAGPSLAQLNAAKGPFETYLSHVIGDGKRHTLHMCRAQGLSSLLEPNPEVLKLFHFFPVWGRVLSSAEVDTVRLDDIPETAGVDFIKIDIQGAELMAFQGAVERLKHVSAIQTEALFLPMYKNQPLFSELELFLRAQGFMFHRFFPVVSRLISPFLINNEVYRGLSQLTQADAVFVRDLTRLDILPDRQLMVMATILHDCYQSFDAVYFLMAELDRRNKTDLSGRYIAALQPYFPGQTLWAWKGPVKGPVPPGS